MIPPTCDKCGVIGQFNAQIHTKRISYVEIAHPCKYFVGKFSKEEIEKDFDQFLKLFTWNYLQKHFISEDKLNVTAEEATAEAKALAQAQFAQYGMPTAPDDMLNDYAKRILADKDQAQKIYEKLYEDKVVADVKSKIKVTEKAVSADDFAKLAKEI